MLGEAPRRIAAVGHFTYFANHFPEYWESDPNVRCFDVNEQDYNFLLAVANFRPHLTLFYRPELYPPELVRRIPGKKIGFLSEPLPSLIDGALIHSDETRVRAAIYQRMDWSTYDAVFYYDEGKRPTVTRLGWPVRDFMPLPIDTRHFKPTARARAIDVCFVGKATARRMSILDSFRYQRRRFVWIAHGVYGSQLARLFQRSKVVVNVHADNLAALEPRVVLAASCGCAVLTETLGVVPSSLSGRLVEFRDTIYGHVVDHAVRLHDASIADWIADGALVEFSVRRFVAAQFAA